MKFSVEPFHGLREHAAATMQEPTSWRVDPNANTEITMNARFGEYRGSLDPSTPMQFLGIDVIIDDSLPPNRVVLKAGKNSVGAFTIGVENEPDKREDLK